MLVEDEELFAMKLGKDFDRENIIFTHFDRVENAIEALKEDDDYHAVVTDMFLHSKEPNGLEIVEQAKKQGLPVIIITSALDLDIAKQGLNRGADYLLEKPFNIKDLRIALLDIWENPRGLIGRRERCFDQHNLTPKEREFARLILKGLSNKEIAEVQETTVATVKFYTNQIFEKCGVSSRGELFSYVLPT